ncbi:hypothetical protein AAFC00_002322 [Neodothiora populina]
MPVKRRGPPPKRRHILVDSQAKDDRPSVEAEESAVIQRGDDPPVDPRIAYRPIPDYLTPSDTPLFERICSARVFDIIVRDYLDILYPLVPVVHRPTFLNDLRDKRYMHDHTFESFCLAICSLVLGILPRKFDEYRQIDGSLNFPSRRAAAETIHEMIMKSRPVNYFDTLCLDKWAIAYMLAASDVHLGHAARGRMRVAETNSICDELGLQRIGSYAGLDRVESQLRKKAFWLNFTTYSHSRSGEIQWDSLGDRFMFDTVDAELLMPLDVDDEFIFPHEVPAQPPGRTPLVAGFNALTLINNCLVSIIKDPALPLLSCTDANSSHRTALGQCACGRLIQKASISSLVQARLQKTRHVLDHLPPELRLWPSHDQPNAALAVSDPILYAQYESMKANIHVTHLWVQSLLLERFISTTPISQGSDGSDGHVDMSQIWEMREDICRQLLRLLSNISQANLEPNGYILILKTRQVAASLLDRQPEEGENVSRRVTAYIQSFADILARLDHAYQNDTRMTQWEELDEQARESPSSLWSIHS